VAVCYIIFCIGMNILC